MLAYSLTVLWMTLGSKLNWAKLVITKIFKKPCSKMSEISCGSWVSSRTALWISPQLNLSAHIIPIPLEILGS